MTTPKKPRGRNGGRKKIGEDRGGLTPLLVQVFGDQAAWLAKQENQQAAIRAAIDLKIKEEWNEIYVS
jgi:hypothetical protein